MKQTYLFGSVTEHEKKNCPQNDRKQVDDIHVPTAQPFYSVT